MIPASNRLRLSALLVVLCAGLLAAACGSDDDSTGSDTSSTELVRTTPEAKGPIDSVTWNLPLGEPTSLDPTQAYNYSENTVLSNVCEGLVRINSDGEVEPALAEKVEHPSPTEWVYTLRDGVKFFDGAALTPDDVVFSISRHLDPKLASFYGLPWGQQIASVKATGDNEVTVTTRAPNTLVNSLMATGLGTVVEAKSIREQGKDFGTAAGTLQCTGPFELASWKPGSSITLTRNPDYWDEGLTAKAERFQFKFITDQTALANALTSGEVDGTYEAPVAATAKLENASNGSLYFGPSTQVLALLPTSLDKVNLDLRKSLSTAIDRDAIAKTAFSGDASAMWSYAAPESASYGKKVFEQAYEKLPDPGPDPDKARELASKSGVSGALTMAVQAGDPSLSQSAAAIQDAAKEAGVTIKIETLPPPQFVGLFFDPEARAAYDLLLAPTFSDLYDPLDLYYIAFLRGSIQNVNQYGSAQLDELINHAVGIGDETARAEAAVAAGDPINRDLPAIPIVRINERLFMNDRITGAPVTFPYLWYPWAASVGAGS
jgi:peptide/nickel transport system substrate-binding protein